LIRSVQYGITKVHRNKKGIFRISQETNGRSIAGIEKYPVIDGNILDRFGRKPVELIFEPDLHIDGFCRVIGDVVI